MKLSEILRATEYTCTDFQDREIKDIAYNSRKAGEGIIFVCLCGALTDGHKYAEDAYSRGSRVFVCQRELTLPSDALIIRVPDTRQALALMSCSFFRHPSREIDVIGITGTKGKTTTAHIIKSILDNADIMTGIIGTVGASYGDVSLPTVNTTPESYELQKMLRLMADGGCKAAVIEVSSLGLKFHRTDGTEFAYGVFTNLFPDHIGTNEHESFQEYAFWKTQLFPLCKKALVNIDDAFSQDIINTCRGQVKTYGYDKNAHYRLISAERLRKDSLLSMSFTARSDGRDKEYILSLPGDFNCHNALAAIAIAEDYGLSKKEISRGLMQVSVKGRCQVVRESTDFTVIIDYAHNGVSLKSIIETARAYEHNRIITLFGSVGGRTECRREELGSVSGAMSDLTVITSDDPDFEDPLEICKEIAVYCEKAGGEYVILPDRKEAVAYAIGIARKGDIVILAGKGHEEYMKIKGERVPFNEKQEVLKALSLRKED